jgi:hypothetical protein
MKTNQFKTTDKPGPKKEMVVPANKVKHEPQVWLQIIEQDIRDLFLLTKDKVPLPNKPKVESLDDWKDYFRR